MFESERRVKVDRLSAILEDAEDQLGEIADVPTCVGAAANAKLQALVRLVDTVTPAQGEVLVDPVEHLQRSLDKILYGSTFFGANLSELVDRASRVNSVTLAVLALSYARSAIVDVWRQGTEPEANAGWPRLWQAMLSKSFREKHGGGVHAGYLIDLDIIRAAEEVLYCTQSSLEASDHSRPLISACLRLFRGCPIPYRDVARKSGVDHHLHLVRDKENPAILLLHLPAENPPPLE